MRLRVDAVDEQEIAPRKKPIAPTNVPRFVYCALRISSVDGTTYDAIAEIPNATEPPKLSTAIYQSRRWGYQESNRPGLAKTS